LVLADRLAGLLARVVRSEGVLGAEAPALVAEALAREAARRALARCGRVRGSCERSPAPSSTGGAASSSSGRALTRTSLLNA
jgi:hypothetical protein